MAVDQGSLWNGRRASVAIDVAVVGAGIGGLGCAFALGSAGHRVVVLEKVRSRDEAAKGFGMLIEPNLFRILASWGLGPKLLELGGTPSKGLRLAAYTTGESLGYSPFEHVLESDYGAPGLQIERRDLYAMLYDLATKTGNVDVRYGCAVKSVNAVTPAVILASGSEIKADLIIGAEGVSGEVVRPVVLGTTEDIKIPKDTISQVTVPLAALMADPAMRLLAVELTVWFGPERCVMGFPTSKDTYNLSFQYPGVDASESQWDDEGDLPKIRNLFREFDPRIGKLLQLAKKASKNLVIDRPSNPYWVHEGGRVALLGDCCHPTLPPRRHGSGLALGDAVVLGSLFSRLDSLSQIPAFTRAYAEIRYPRCTRTQEDSRESHTQLMMAGGQHEALREHVFSQISSAELAENSQDPSNIDEWSYWRTKEETFATDAEEDAEDWWVKWGLSTQVPDVEVALEVQVRVVEEN